MIQLKKTINSQGVPICIAERYRSCDGPTLKIALWFLLGNTGSADIASKELGIPLETVKRAIDFWLSAGMLEDTKKAQKKDSAPTPVLGKPLSATDLSERMLRDPSTSALLQETQKTLGRVLTHNESSRLLLLYEQSALPADVLIMAAGYAKNRAKRNVMGYIERIVSEWGEDGITSVTQAEERLRLLELRESREAAVAGILGIEGSINYRDRQKIAIWFEEWGYGEAFVREAYLHTGNPSVSYNHAVLRDWHQKGFRTVSETRTAPINAPAPVRKKKSSGSLVAKALKKGVLSGNDDSEKKEE